MPFRYPEYITGAGIATPEIRYPWDDWNVVAAYQPADEALLERMKPLSRPALTALTIASAEWLVYRLNELEDDPNPPDFLEATWAACIHPGYMVYAETDDLDWRGPVRGPINLAMMMMLDLLFVYGETEGPVPHAAWMSKLVELVLPDRTAFQEWQSAAIARLTAHYPAPDASDLWGPERREEDAVPREAFDPHTDFDPSRSSALLDRFLRGLDVEENLFLHPAEEMLQRGFQGVPYRIQSQIQP